MSQGSSDIKPMDDLQLAKSRGLLAVFAVLLVLVVFPWTTEPAIDAKILLIHIGACVLMGWLVFLRKQDEDQLSITPLHLLVLGWFGITLIASFRSGLLLYSLVEVSKFASLGILFLMAAYCYRQAKDLEWLAVAVCAAMAVSSIAMFVQVASSERFDWNISLAGDEVFPGTFGNPNFAIHTIVMCVVLTLWLITHPKWRWCAVFLIPFGIHHYLTGQRGGMVGLTAAGILFLIAWTIGSRMRRPVHGVLVTLAGFLLIGFIAIAGATGVLRYRHDSWLPLDGSSVARYHATACALNMVSERPILGFGPGMFVVDNAPYWTSYEQHRFADTRRMHRFVHNDIVETFVETGVIGGIFHVASLVAAITLSLMTAFGDPDPSRRKLGYALAALFTGFAVDGFFGFNLRVPVSSALFFILLGALAGIRGSHMKLASIRPQHPLLLIALVLLLGNTAFGARVFASRAFLHTAMIKSTTGASADEVDSYMERAERFAPWDWRVSFQRGSTELNQEKPHEAILHLRRALSLNPFYVPAHLGLSQGLYNFGAALLEINGVNSETERIALQAFEQAEFHADVLAQLCPPLPESYDLKARTAAFRAQRDALNGNPTMTKTHWQNAEYYANRAIERGVRRPSELIVILYRAALYRDDHEAALNALIRGIRAGWSNELIESELQALTALSKDSRTE